MDERPCDGRPVAPIYMPPGGSGINLAAVRIPHLIELLDDLGKRAPEHGSESG